MAVTNWSMTLAEVEICVAVPEDVSAVFSAVAVVAPSCAQPPADV